MATYYMEFSHANANITLHFLYFFLFSQYNLSDYKLIIINTYNFDTNFITIRINKHVFKLSQYSHLFLICQGF